MENKNLFTVQEFAQLSGVEASTLRYWDDIGLFSPIQRNPDTNYRYYSLAQILALNFVTVLSDLDFPLKTIAELRQNRDPDKILALLDKQEKEMDMEMQRLRLRYSIIHARRELITNGIKAPEAEIAVVWRDSLDIMVWPLNEYNEGETFIEPMAGFINQAQDQHINLSFPVGGCFDSFETLKSGTNRPQHFISIDPIGNQKIKEGDYLSGYTRGYYGEMGDLPAKMEKFAKKEQLTMAEPVYVIYLLEEICMQNPDEYLVQILVPVKKQAASQSKPKGRSA
ncbi:MAG: MerR family transcriptional regulator [Clostridiales bacterium]|nr:MerR family transcriptional regulator [Clostridiales bacterium]